MSDIFFNRKHKSLAFRNSASQLKSKYKKSERELLKTARSGDEKALAEVMKKHGEYEYAMLFQKTPEFKERKKGIWAKKQW